MKKFLKKFSNRIEFEPDLYRPDEDKPFGFQSCITGFGAIGYTHLSHSELQERLREKYGAGDLIDNAGYLTFRYAKERVWNLAGARTYIAILQSKAMVAGTQRHVGHLTRGLLLVGCWCGGCLQLYCRW